MGIFLKQAGAELCQAQANLDSSVLIVEFVFIFEVVFQNNSNYCVLVGHAYVLSFRPVALQIRTIPGGVGSGGKHWVIMLASPAKLGLGLSLAI